MMQFKTYNLTDKQSVRNSGIELLKILGIFLIVVSHVTQTLCSANLFISYQDYVLDLSIATTNYKQLCLTILRYSGVIGNNIFFVSSAWFLLDNDKCNAKKWFFMLVEIWLVSVAILLISYIARSGNIDKGLLIKSLMPTTFATNWYMTCYLLFYPLHPVLNDIIKGMSKVQLFRASMALAVIYIGLNFVIDNAFFSSPIILWVTIYFVIAYIKIYLPGFSSDRMANIALLCYGIVGHIGLILVTNFLGLRMNAFSDRLLDWAVNCNPFIILSIIALFNLVRSVKFENRFINTVSSLSLIIYIMHENIILRTYYRPYIIHYIYENYGYSHIVMWILILSLVIFVAFAAIGFIYDLTLRNMVRKLSIGVYNICHDLWQIMEINALKMH